MHMVPGHLVPHNGSPIDWSPWTNSPQPIRFPRTDGSQKFGPHGQMVPNKWSLENLTCQEGQAVGIQTYRDQTGWAPFVQGDQIGWGPFVHEDPICWGFTNIEIYRNLTNNT